MNRRRNNNRPAQPGQTRRAGSRQFGMGPETGRKSRRTPWLCAGILLGGITVYAWKRPAGSDPTGETSSPEPQSSIVSRQSSIRTTDAAIGYYPTVDQLMALQDSDLERVDPLVVNLAVARGIPEFADLDVERYVRTLDAWAEEIRFDTQRHWYRFDRDPDSFDNSRVEYRIMWLCSDVNAVFQVDYDLADFDAAEPSNLFINGLVDRRLGTCVSMPMLYVALGWRLSYPIKLVAVPTHLFARWNDGQNRINIEATGYGGKLPDSFYEEQYFVSPRCKQRGAELASLTPRQALAEQILARGACWERRGQAARYLEDALRANLLFPDSPLAVTQLRSAYTLRNRADDYFAHASEHLAVAVGRLQKRVRKEQSEPMEKLIFTKTGPTRVHVDPRTGKKTRIE